MRKNTPIQPAPCAPAAQYVRMSTEDQRYSIDNQIAGIGEYAAKHGFTIIQTYEDSGKSGLVLKHRHGLVKLLRDVLSGKVAFKASWFTTSVDGVAFRMPMSQHVTSSSARTLEYP